MCHTVQAAQLSSTMAAACTCELHLKQRSDGNFPLNHQTRVCTPLQLWSTGRGRSQHDLQPSVKGTSKPFSLCHQCIPFRVSSVLAVHRHIMVTWRCIISSYPDHRSCDCDCLQLKTKQSICGFKSQRASQSSGTLSDSQLLDARSYALLQQLVWMIELCNLATIWQCTDAGL